MPHGIRKAENQSNRRAHGDKQIDATQQRLWTCDRQVLMPAKEATMYQVYYLPASLKR